jgi:hypothetical protein
MLRCLQPNTPVGYSGTRDMPPGISVSTHPTELRVH